MVKEKEPKPFHKGWIVFIVALFVIHLYQLPYYYTQPGDATALASVIEVEDGYDEEGSFMLTTVRMGKANLFFYTWAQFSEYREIFPEEQVRRPDESDEDYQHRQTMMMTSSQEAAKIVAYDRAGKSVRFEHHGILVTSFIEGMPAAEKLEREDRIIAVDGERVTMVEELLEQLAQKDQGDHVQLTVTRDGETFDVALSVEPFPEELGVDSERGGIGITYPVMDRTIYLEPDVEINTNNIGGPSAGLMFSLEIFNQLVEEDMTKGYQIAGTGTLNEDGEVGSIGGVKQKIVAADKAGVDLFFVPNEGGRADSNYMDALEAATNIATNMEVIPVDTFDEAVDVLQSLPDKK